MLRSQLALNLRGIVVIAALMLSGGSACAQGPDIISANGVLPGCINALSDQPNSNLAWETGYCQGIVSTLSYMEDQLCFPKGVTTGQQIRVIVRYINDRPERMHENFKALALEAMKAAWPCKL